MRSRFVTSPIRSTSKRPSSGSASGVIFIPPARKRPLATITSYIGPLRSASSTVTVSCTFFQRTKTATVLHAYEALPPSAFPVSFTRLATAPLMPALAMFANHWLASGPAHVR